ncbi:hypothetical protein [Silvibacterium acidisoli]|jgi:uncharacterized membrane protein affecting hemolysin expression|uniref:hypothetical protein n=1 Tax=Acidobacteriaceae bacterium ZG23-2 TaxID=2883246 RepID=UPI00406C2511
MNHTALYATIVVACVVLVLLGRVLLMFRRHRRRQRLMTSSPSLHYARKRINADPSLDSDE